MLHVKLCIGLVSLAATPAQHGWLHEFVTPAGRAGDVLHRISSWRLLLCSVCCAVLSAAGVILLLLVT
jgi:hypothetical protein